MEIRSSKTNAFEKLTIRLKELNGIEGKVGWFESSRYEDGTYVAGVAYLNEFGHGNTPPRPFMRPTVEEKKPDWVNLAAEGAKASITGNVTATQVMEGITKKAEDDIVGTIVNLYSPALSPVTIELRAMKKRNPNLKITGATVGEAARKVAQPGYQTPSVSTKPLNDSGVMIATLTHTVEKK